MKRKEEEKVKGKEKFFWMQKKDLAIYIPLENFRHKYNNCAIVSVH